MSKLNINESVRLPGYPISMITTIEADQPRRRHAVLTPALVGMLSTRSTDTSGIITMGDDQSGVEAGDLIDICWPAGFRAGFTVVDVDGLDIQISSPLDFGALALPSQGADVQIARRRIMQITPMEWAGLKALIYGGDKKLLWSFAFNPESQGTANYYGYFAVTAAGRYGYHTTAQLLAGPPVTWAGSGTPNYLGTFPLAEDLARIYVSNVFNLSTANVVAAAMHTGSVADADSSYTFGEEFSDEFNNQFG